MVKFWWDVRSYIYYTLNPMRTKIDFQFLTFQWISVLGWIFHQFSSYLQIEHDVKTQIYQKLVIPLRHILSHSPKTNIMFIEYTWSTQAFASLHLETLYIQYHSNNIPTSRFRFAWLVPSILWLQITFWRSIQGDAEILAEWEAAKNGENMFHL